MTNRVLKTLAVAGALLVPVAVATLFTARGVDAQGQSSVGNPQLLAELRQLRAQVTALESSVQGLKPRRFYLTEEEIFTGGTAFTACEAGFHMASLWEVWDPTNLKYDTALGFTTADSGSGPPTGRMGMIRTGFIASNTDSPGSGNCNAWTSSAVEDRGTRVRLSKLWDANPTELFPTEDQMS